MVSSGLDDDRAGARSHTERLYRRYAHWLRAVVLRRFGPSLGGDAEDLVQETYIRVAGSGIGEEVRHPRAYLLQVASNLAYSQLRTARRRQAAAQLQVEPWGENDEHVVLSDQDEAVLLRQLITALPKLQRDVFVLSRFGGLTNQDIADRLGISVKTVEWRMSRALTSLVAALAEAKG